ncbi:MAG: hypothetical protein AB7O52_16880 [Planctomycetota bacterium]
MQTRALARWVACAAIVVSSTLAAAAPPETVDLRVESQPLLVLCERLARQCEVGLVVHREAVESLQQSVSIYAKDAKWDDALKLFREEYGVELRLTERRLEVLDAAADFRKRIQRQYFPTAQITASVDDYPAPKLGFEAEEEFGGGVLNFSDEDGPPPLIADLAGLVEHSVGSLEHWERDGVGLTLTDDGGLLSVQQVPELQAGVRTFLATLERNATRQLVCRLHRLPDETVPGQSIAKSAYAELTRNRRPEASFMVGDGQRNHHYAGNVRTFVAESCAVGKCIDPVVRELRSGLALDVEPHVTREGVLANISLSRCTNSGSTRTGVVTADGLSQVEIELPILQHEKTGDSRLVPLGGAVVYLLGDEVYGVSFEVFEQ